MYAADRDNGSLPLIRSQSGRPVVDVVHLVEKERDRLYQIGVIGSWFSKLVNGPAPSSRAAGGTAQDRDGSDPAPAGMIVVMEKGPGGLAIEVPVRTTP